MRHPKRRAWPRPNFERVSSPTFKSRNREKSEGSALNRREPSLLYLSKDGPYEKVAARVDSPSTAIRRYHLVGYYWQNSLDHLLSK